ncbi:MAG: alpha/beta hydrolase family protein [Spirochaetia bacterium]
MKAIIQSIGKAFLGVFNTIFPFQLVEHKLSIGILISAFIIWLNFSFSQIIAGPGFFLIIFLLFIFPLLVFIISIVFLLLQALFKHISFPIAAAFSFFLVFTGAVMLQLENIGLVLSVVLLFLIILLLTPLLIFISGSFGELKNAQKIFLILELILSSSVLITFSVFFWIIPAFTQPAEMHFPASMVETPVVQSPGERGQYNVLEMYYGTGTDQLRSEYSEYVNLRTDPVDFSSVIQGWSGITGFFRTSFWGFTPEAFPINGRVWYPQGDGRFPLVLIVHGNHQMQDFSDPGYRYLGEHLASIGYIAVSIDENFLNMSLYDVVFGGIENDIKIRSLLLLEHLRNWQEWTETPGNPFYNKADISRIAVIGHSRGGEAAAAAAYLATIDRLPGEATYQLPDVPDIDSVIALSPTNSMYSSYDRQFHLENTCYLVLHGTHDRDIQQFHGLEQYDAVSAESTYRFAMLVYGANHNSWNTGWGSTDIIFPASLFQPEQYRMSPEAQQQYLITTASAFLDLSLFGNTQYLNFLQDPNRYAEWIPETYVFTRDQGPYFQAIADFNEDTDPETASIPGSISEAESILRWHEGAPTLSHYGDSERVLHLTISPETPGRYQVSVPRLSLEEALLFDIAYFQEPAHPADQDFHEVFLELEITVSDTAGRSASAIVTDFTPVMPQIETEQNLLYQALSIQPHIPVYQTCRIPATAFISESDVNIHRISEISFLFPQLDEEYSVMLDNIGICR